MDDRIPPFLTVEEASRLLKIGRTKAYLLTKEWRATGGRSGLPVVDLGDVLRVPGPAIERMLGTGLGAAVPDLGKPARVKPEGPAAAPSASPQRTPQAAAVEPDESLNTDAALAATPIVSPRTPPATPIYRPTPPVPTDDPYRPQPRNPYPSPT
ncbi:MAG: helix-turn-helix domain-containing protein [Acidimicrobiia bacterium]